MNILMVRLKVSQRVSVDPAKSPVPTAVLTDYPSGPGTVAFI